MGSEYPLPPKYEIRRQRETGFEPVKAEFKTALLYSATTHGRALKRTETHPGRGQGRGQRAALWTAAADESNPLHAAAGKGSERVTAGLYALTMGRLPPSDVGPVERRLVDLPGHQFVIAVMQLDQAVERVYVIANL